MLTNIVIYIYNWFLEIPGKSYIYNKLYILN